MTELSFDIEFPRFKSPIQRVIFSRGIHVIYGESGTGKTHLCQILSGLDISPDPSNFRIHHLSSLFPTALIMQDPDSQIVSPSLLKELAFNFENRGLPTNEIQRNIMRCMKKYKIEWDLTRHPSSLSGGEKEILNIITALTLKPKCIIIDDGMAFLSEGNKKRMVSLLKEYIHEIKGIVIWMTTTPFDKLYADKFWEIRLDQFSPNITENVPILNIDQLKQGSAILTCDELSFAYGNNGPIFNHISFRIGPFRSLAILGENGVGKTTLGLLMSGILQSTHGKVSINLTGKKRVKCGLLPQFPEQLLGGNTFEELINELMKSNLIHKKNLQSLIHSLKKFQISWKLVKNKSIHSLKISIIRIVIIQILCFTNYDIIIFDEPFFSLGSLQRIKILEFLKEILKKKHFIIISHDKSYLEKICDNHLVIGKNQITLSNQQEKSYVE